VILIFNTSSWNKIGHDKHQYIYGTRNLLAVIHEMSVIFVLL